MSCRHLGLLTLFAVLFVKPTPAVPPAKANQCVLTNEDYAVYSALLLDRGKPEDPEERWDDKPDLVLLDSTDTGEDGKSLMWGFRSASKQAPSDATVDNFNARRQSLCQLQPQFEPTVAYHFFTQKERDSLFKKKGIARGWREFYKKYPHSSGYWSLSPVGYDPERLEALVYVGHHCGGLCGTGHLVLLAKEDGRWNVKNRVMLWIS